MAESIWTVSSEASNINHIIIAMHGYNQFTFNVSIVLLLAAMGSLAASKKTRKMQLVKSEMIYDKILKLNVSDQNAKHILMDFLTLFQTFQRLVCLPQARDECLREMLVFQKKHLEELGDYLKKVNQMLNKTILDQHDINDNTRVSV